jgi:hypothetical protein
LEFVFFWNRFTTVLRTLKLIVLILLDYQRFEIVFQTVTTEQMAAISHLCWLRIWICKFVCAETYAAIETLLFLFNFLIFEDFSFKFVVINKRNLFRVLDRMGMICLIRLKNEIGLRLQIVFMLRLHQHDKI